MERVEHIKTPERRIDSKIRLMRIGGVACALFAAAGICDGIHQASPDNGWLVPALAGVAAALGFAIFWHVVINTVVGMIRQTMIVALFVLATFVTVIALGASAQGIATAIAGRPALTAELSAVIDGYNQRLTKAYAEATGWSAAIGEAAAKAAGARASADLEKDGSHGTGKGCGPNCASYLELASGFENAKTALEDLLHQAQDKRDHGAAAMGDMREAAAEADQKSFMAATQGVTNAIEELNAINSTQIIHGVGRVTINGKGLDLSKETKEFYASADKALTNRQQVVAPVFTPMSIGEATRRQVLGSAMHGWILAGVIDVVPMILLILAYLLSRETWMNEAVTRVQVTHEGQDIIDRRRLGSLMNRDEEDQNVVRGHFPGAAE